MTTQLKIQPIEAQLDIEPKQVTSQINMNYMTDLNPAPALPRGKGGRFAPRGGTPRATPAAAPAGAATPAAPAATPAAPATPAPPAGQSGGIMNTIKNWFSSKPQPTGTPISAPQLAASLSQAINGFAQAFNSQIHTFNPSIKAINKVVQGLASQQGSQMLQFNPAIAGQVQQLVTTMNEAVKAEAMDSQFISQLAQQALALSQIVSPKSASTSITPRMGSASTLISHIRSL